MVTPLRASPVRPVSYSHWDSPQSEISNARNLRTYKIGPAARGMFFRERDLLEGRIGRMLALNASGIKCGDKIVTKNEQSRRFRSRHMNADWC